MNPVVGIGASAGGLEAISRFLDAMPAESGCAFVVVVHLQPAHESAFASLLGRHTPMPVVDISDGMIVKPDSVHVIVPDRTLSISDGTLYLRQAIRSYGCRFHPIDDFFESLAQDVRERAIGIVLSGTGGNGTHGLRAIRAHGGMTLVQEPESAQFDGMPRSAISAGVADQVLAPEKMPEALLRYVRHRYIAAPSGVEAGIPDGPQSLDAILAIVSTCSGHAFGGYKRNTLLRRVHRRMGLRDLRTLADYATLLGVNADEIKALAKDLMITVTGFFRDPEAWQALDATVLSPLVNELKTGTPIRFWVPACASGEEAYSLAMLTLERAEAAGKRFDLRIFATDPQESNLRAARQGIYPIAAAEAVSSERLDRFFNTLDNAYQVKKELRERVVFAQQDLMIDPPFSRLDLISCRNLMIYLDGPAQRRLVALFHFALREGGALFLGSAETIGSNDDLFEHVSKTWRIYRRLGPTRHDIVPFPTLTTSRRSQDGNVLAQADPELSTRAANVARRALLERYAPASALIDQKGRILYFHGPTGDYLQQPTGEPTRELLGMARQGLRGRLRSAVRQAIASAETVTFVARVRQDGTVRPTSVTVAPVPAPGWPTGLLLVSFAPTPDELSTECVLSEDGAAGTRALEDELRAARTELQNTIAQFEITSEELKAANEEVTLMNEELRSTNEELETSKEELHSYNEELNTTNSELQSKIQELTTLSENLDNLLNSTDIATIFLDTEMRINWFTPGSRDLFDLRLSDIGRPIGNFAVKFVDAQLLRDGAAVLEKLISVEAEVRSDVGRWYLRRMLPYRTKDNHIAGIVVTFVDITERKQTADAVNAARIYAETIIETTQQPLLVLSSDMRIRSANQAFCALFDLSATEAENSLIYQLGNRQWDIPELRSLLAEVFNTSAQIDGVTIQQNFSGLGRCTLVLSARKFPGHTEIGNLILLAIEDITERIRNEAQLKHDAAHDGLTGLPNRREFERRLQRTVLSAQKNSSEHALCYFDLDQFKLINDTAGHAAGDTLLQQVRGLLADKFRDRDTLARLGGDEFALLLEECSLSDANRIAEIIVATFREWRFVWEGRSLQVGASAGVVAITAQSESGAQVLSQADVACYTAKEAGRNRVVVYGAEPSPHHAQIFVAATLKQAIEQNRFRLFCQPIVSLAANGNAAPLHYEILIRLLDDEGRVTLPDTFIPAAERFGKMAAIDRWVIATAFRMYADSGSASTGPQIAINLSGGSLNTDDFATFVVRQLAATGVPADRICFEITETAAIHNLDQTIEFIGEMKARGSRFALDDFGSGFSSFRYLRVLPADYLKIDGSFVQQMADNAQDEALVAAINEMAHALGMKTIAEFAHNGAVVDRLQRLCVDYAQGYAFAAPMPLDTLF